jgi:hypothetical protein
VSRVALWLVGPPAAGKTTLARSFLGFDDGRQNELVLVPKPKWTLFDFGRVVAAGHYTGATFDGADKVPYHGAREALEYWLRELQPRAELTIFDGDRFSNDAAVAYVSRYVDRVEVRYVDAAPDVLAARRAARNWDPNQAWVKGRVTKAQRFAERWK